MKYDGQQGLYIAEKETLENFCKGLIEKRDSKHRSVMGEYNNSYICAGPTETVDSLIKQYWDDRKGVNKKCTRDSVRKNRAGYDDPTAFKAITRLDKELAERKRARKGV